MTGHDGNRQLFRNSQTEIPATPRLCDQKEDNPESAEDRSGGRHAIRCRFSLHVRPPCHWQSVPGWRNHSGRQAVYCKQPFLSFNRFYPEILKFPKAQRGSAIGNHAWEIWEHGEHWGQWNPMAANENGNS
jgi:hypothetical protein